MKEYKITVNPYLNKRVQPYISTILEIGGNTDVELYPLYYKVTFKRQNTHFRSTYNKDGFKPLSHFHSLDHSKFNSFDPLPIIERDKIIIGQIIRHCENQDQNFTVIGLKKKYEEYTESLFVVLNKKLNEYLKDKLTVTHQYSVLSILNYEDNSFYTLFKTIEVLLNDSRFFSKSEKSTFKLMRKFFKLYDKGQNKKGFFKFHLDIPTHSLNDPILIDFYSGILLYDMSDKGINEALRNNLLENIDRILNREPEQIL